MKNIKVALLHHTPLYISADGARTCWSSQDKSDTSSTLDKAVEDYCKIAKIDWTDAEAILSPSIIGPKDLALIDRVGNQFHHASILEHISFNFFIDGISRACLQELARHRLASLSVKSSRYTLKELKDEPLLSIEEQYKKYIVFTGNAMVDMQSIKGIQRLQFVIKEGISNDIAKYCMPESYRTQLTWTINLRSLQNFLSLRTDKKALPEIQHLANLIYSSLPTDIQSLVKHCVTDEVAKEKELQEKRLRLLQIEADEDQ